MESGQVLKIVAVVDTRSSFPHSGHSFCQKSCGTTPTCLLGNMLTDFVFGILSIDNSAIVEYMGPLKYLEAPKSAVQRTKQGRRVEGLWQRT